MTDPLPADVRAFLEARAEFGRDAPPGLARDLLDRYPKPAPAWQPGDVVLEPSGAYLRFRDGLWRGADASDVPDDSQIVESADLIARGGRRVHPARFHDHAETLRSLASCVLPSAWQHVANGLLAIADDIDPES